MKRLLLGFVSSLFALQTATQPAAGSEVAPPIPIEYFGLHIHRSDQGTAWPNVPFGSWRLWDAYVTWAQIQPRREVWDFSRLDRYVAMARLAKVDVLLPLANTPTWASARPNEPSGYQRGNASEPIRMEEWRAYVRAVGERYKGRIKLFEIWNEPNIPHHFSGTPEKMVELTCEAFHALKAIDLDNRIVSPAASSGARGHVDYLDRFLALGGGRCIDIVAHHFYVPNGGPEGMVPMIRQVKAVMRKNGVGNKPLWNTETGWWIANGDGTPDHPMVAKGGWKKLGLERESGDYLLRAFLLGRAEGLDRFYWYSWDNQYGLGLVEPTAGTPKQTVERWRATVELLLGATGVSCAQLGQAWTCSFVDRLGATKKESWVGD